MPSNNIVIFDTTLRDGEQSPGASMTIDEKVHIAKSLELLGVDIIEAGFPVASDGDLQAVQEVSNNITKSRVCALARAIKNDIEKAGLGIKKAKLSRIHTFIATSDIHMKYKLRMSPKEVLEQGVMAVKLARKYTDSVEFSAEDAIRSNQDFLCKIIEPTIEAGATTINLPDTVGYSVPEQIANLFKQVIEKVPNSDKAIFSCHCHNDLGLAVSNSLAAVLAGARQIECTINGIGERAGNAALEEVTMALKTRKDFFKCNSNINSKQLINCSRLVSSVTGFAVQPNKAIVGANAYTHESGIHQDGVLKHKSTYEIMSAEDIGLSNNSIILGKHSGRSALKMHLDSLGLIVNDEHEINDIFKRFKTLADQKHKIYAEDLQALFSDLKAQSHTEHYSLLDIKVNVQRNKQAHAIIKLAIDDKEYQDSDTGVGAIDAVFKTIEKIVQSNAQLKLYSVNAITGGTNAQGEVTVRLAKQQKISNGKGTDIDIVTASAKAYINALNIIEKKQFLQCKLL